MSSMPMIYFDHAATTPLDPAVFAAMEPYFQDSFYNPSALYAPARAVRNAVEDARHAIAMTLGAKPTEIIFTSGGTEANNLAIQGVLRDFVEGNLVVSAIEHESVLAPARRYSVKECPVLADGVIDVAQLKTLIDDQTMLVSVMYANNEVGTIQPIREIVKFVETVRAERMAAGNSRPLYVHTDACQAANYLDLHVSRLGVDLMTLNGSKMYGPKGTGILYVRTGTVLQPLMLGGGQESGLRSGTENVAGAVGIAKALEISSKMRDAEAARLTALRDQLITTITSANNRIQVNGSQKHRLANNIHVTISGKDAETLVLQLENKGLLCAVGSACSASSQEPSHVLLAMGLSEADARSSLRITLGRSTDEAAILALAHALIELAI